MVNNNIIEVTEIDFEYEVIAYSRNSPVVVDFWAAWCQPCKPVGRILETITNESGGMFRLARVNTDDNPNLAIQFGVRSLPTIKAFSGGQVVGELVGEQPEGRVREFISRITPPSPLVLKTEKGEGYLAGRDWQQAASAFTEALEGSAGNSAALLGWGIALLGLGKGYQAREIFENFPSSKEYSRAVRLLPLAEAFVRNESSSASGENDLDLAYENCIRLARQAKFEAAVDGLLDILRQDKHYRNGLAQNAILGILEVISGSEETVRKYRKELTSIIY